MDLQSSWKIPGFFAIFVALPRHGCRVLATAALLAMVGCATVPETPEARAKAVEVRAQERWDLLLKGQMEAAYAYTSPASRQVYSLEKFKAGYGRGGFRKATVERVSCPAQTCEVKLMLTYDHKRMKGIATPVNETWVWSDGQAWYFVRE